MRGVNRMNVRQKGKSRRGSSTIEYILGVAAVISVLLVFLRPGGHFSRTFTSTLNSVTDSMELSAARLESSHSLSSLTPSTAIGREIPESPPIGK